MIPSQPSLCVRFSTLEMNYFFRLINFRMSDHPKRCRDAIYMWACSTFTESCQVHQPTFGVLQHESNTGTLSVPLNYSDLGVITPLVVIQYR
jgi:hypothetical protein